MECFMVRKLNGLSYYLEVIKLGKTTSLTHGHFELSM